MTSNYQLISTNEQLEETVTRIAKNHRIIAIDTEGDLDVFSGTTVLVQIGVPGISYLVDIRNITNTAPLKALFENEDIVKILQNAKYDYQVIKHNYGIEINNIYDTMLAEQLLLAGRYNIGDFSLAAIAKKYLDETLNKGIRPRFENNPVFFTNEMLVYAAADVSTLLLIKPLQEEAIMNEGLRTIALLEFAVAPVVAELELNGVLIDLEKWNELTEWFKEQRNNAAKLIYSMAKEKVPQMAMFEDTPLVNLNSPKQVKELLALFDINVPNTRAATLRLKDHPIPKALVQYKTYQKLISSFGEPFPGFIRKETGRIHADFIQLGAQSGRFSCRNPNLQQIPIRTEESARFRQCFVAPPGKKLITADYSQIEMRIIAEWSKDKELLRAFTSGGDIHRWVASKLFRKDYNAISKAERSVAKNMVYGMSYGMSAVGFARRAEISEQEAEALLQTFKGAFPVASKWLYSAGKATLSKKFSKTLWGRKRWFTLPLPNDEHYDYLIGSIAREGRNHAVQGTGGDMLKLAMLRLYNALKPYGGKLVNCIHDELVIEVDEGIAEEMRQLVHETMLTAGKEVLPTVPVEVDVALGDSWTK
jgi:DNA polymerase-1